MIFQFHSFSHMRDAVSAFHSSLADGVGGSISTWVELRSRPHFPFSSFPRNNISMSREGEVVGAGGWWMRSSDEVKKQLTVRREYFFALYNRALGELVKCMKNIPGGYGLPSSLWPTNLLCSFCCRRLSFRVFDEVFICFESSKCEFIW